MRLSHFYTKRAIPLQYNEIALWGEKDSNLRRRSQQIYSLPPLTAREPPHCRMRLACRIASGTLADKSRQANSGIRTLDPEITNHVLWPAELSWRNERVLL